MAFSTPPHINDWECVPPYIENKIRFMYTELLSTKGQSIHYQEKINLVFQYSNFLKLGAYCMTSAKYVSRVYN